MWGACVMLLQQLRYSRKRLLNTGFPRTLNILMQPYKATTTRKFTSEHCQTQQTLQPWKVWGVRGYLVYLNKICINYKRKNSNCSGELADNTSAKRANLTSPVTEQIEVTGEEAMRRTRFRETPANSAEFGSTHEEAPDTQAEGQATK